MVEQVNQTSIKGRAVPTSEVASTLICLNANLSEKRPRFNNPVDSRAWAAAHTAVQTACEQQNLAGAIIANFRQMAVISRSELAQHTGISPQGIHDLEVGTSATNIEKRIQRVSKVIAYLRNTLTRVEKNYATECQTATAMPQATQIFQINLIRNHITALTAALAQKIERPALQLLRSWSYAVGKEAFDAVEKNRGLTEKALKQRILDDTFISFSSVLEKGVKLGLSAIKNPWHSRYYRDALHSWVREATQRGFHPLAAQTVGFLNSLGVSHTRKALSDLGFTAAETSQLLRFQFIATSRINEVLQNALLRIGSPVIREVAAEQLRHLLQDLKDRRLDNSAQPSQEKALFLKTLQRFVEREEVKASVLARGMNLGGAGERKVFKSLHGLSVESAFCPAVIAYCVSSPQEIKRLRQIFFLEEAQRLAKRGHPNCELRLLRHWYQIEANDLAGVSRADLFRLESNPAIDEARYKQILEQVESVGSSFVKERLSQWILYRAEPGAFARVSASMGTKTPDIHSILCSTVTSVATDLKRRLQHYGDYSTENEVAYFDWMARILGNKHSLVTRAIAVMILEMRGSNRLRLVAGIREARWSTGMKYLSITDLIDPSYLNTLADAFATDPANTLQLERSKYLRVLAEVKEETDLRKVIAHIRNSYHIKNQGLRQDLNLLAEFRTQEPLSAELFGYADRTSIRQRHKQHSLEALHSEASTLLKNPTTRERTLLGRARNCLHRVMCAMPGVSKAMLREALKQSA